MTPPATASQDAPKRSVAIICATADTKNAQALSNFVTQLGLAPALQSAVKGSSDAAALEGLEAARGAEYAIVLSASDGNGVSPLQIGFLLGLVGRNRLCFLGTGKAGAVAGLEAVPRHALDEGELWRLLLAREMKQAGLDIDLNRAM
jgi:hypothetical protein